MVFYEGKDANNIGEVEFIKIKFEVDINPSVGATYETKFDCCQRLIK